MSFLRNAMPTVSKFDRVDGFVDERPPDAYAKATATITGTMIA